MVHLGCRRGRAGCRVLGTGPELAPELLIRLIPFLGIRDRDGDVYEIQDLSATLKALEQAGVFKGGPLEPLEVPL